MRVRELVTNVAFRKAYLENWKSAGVTAICYSLFRFANPYTFESTIEDISDIAYMLDSLPEAFVKVTKAEDLHRAKKEGKYGIVFFIENTEQFAKNLQNIDLFYRLGLRIVQLTYNSMNFVGCGCTERNDTGLSSFGLEVVARLNQLHMMIDLSHCGQKTVADAIVHSRDPVVFTHTFAKSLRDHARGKTDEQLQAVGEKNGYIGVASCPFFITKEKRATIEHYLQHIDHIVQVAGINHVGIGTDWYPPPHRGYAATLNAAFATIGFRPQDRVDYLRTVEGFEDWSDWPNITSGLLARGYSKGDVRKIIGGNFLRVFQRIAG
jgi:membrane dipeptidase